MNKEDRSINPIVYSYEFSKGDIESFKDFLELIIDAVFIHDTKGDIYYVNDAVCKELGYTKEELLSMNISQIDTPSQAALIPDRVEKTLDDNGYFFESEHRTKEGGILPVELHSISIKIDGVDYILTISRNLSERNNMREELVKRIDNLECLDKFGEIIERPGITLDELLSELPFVIEKSFRYCLDIKVKIYVGESLYQNGNVGSADCNYSALIYNKRIDIGRIDVQGKCSFKKCNTCDDKRQLINIIAKRLGHVIERFYIEEEVIRYSEELENRVRERTRELEQKNVELQKALEKVKTLQGLLPICSNCKKVRDDTGYWHSVDEYIESYSVAEVTHSLCPDCVKKLYPEIADDL